MVQSHQQFHEKRTVRCIEIQITVVQGFQPRNSSIVISSSNVGRYLYTPYSLGYYPIKKVTTCALFPIYGSPQIPATFSQTALPNFFLPKFPPSVESSNAFLSSLPSQLSRASVNARGVFQHFWISRALSPVMPRVHINILRKTS